MQQDINLISRPDLWSEELTDLFNKYGADEILDYSELESLLKEANAIGYTFDYDLNGEIFDLQTI